MGQYQLHERKINYWYATGVGSKRLGDDNVSAISSENIISILKSEIENYEAESREHEVGTVIWVGDGIATIYGMEHAMYGEIVIFENV